jgi:hypothetical protein
LDVYEGNRTDDLANYSPENFVETYKLYGFPEAEPILLAMLEDKKIDIHIRQSIADALPPHILYADLLQKYMADQSDPLNEKFLALLILRHRAQEMMKKGWQRVMEKADTTEVTGDRDSFLGTDLEWNKNSVEAALIHTDRSIACDERLLLKSAELTEKGKKTQASYLREIVFQHLTQLKEHGSFEPLVKIERFLNENKDRGDLHWFEYKLSDLKRSYLETIARPSNIMGSIKRYNTTKEKDYLPIATPEELLETIKETVETDLRRWVEKEGAYKSINELAQKKNRKAAEEFIQKSILAQIELSLIKKGFRSSDYRIKREEQLPDDKRLDITISYGFVGSIVLELKLSHNSEAKASTEKAREYIQKLHQYLNGFPFGLRNLSRF